MCWTRRRCRRAWYNIQADSDQPAPAGAAPRHRPADRPGRPGAALPDGAHQAGGQPGALDRHPRRSAGRSTGCGGPTPLYRAHRLEQALDTPARIFYKYEGVSPAGSHKPNTAVAQAYYNKAEGVKRLATETGAGQWGSALAMATRMFGLECKVYMVKVSLPAEALSPLADADVRGAGHPQPQHRDQRRAAASWRKTPNSTGSLGIAISEAVEDAATRDDTKYSLGSVLNHVLMHQTVIGQEAQKQMEMADAYPDVVIGCCRRRQQLRRAGLPVRRRQDHRQSAQHAHRRRRAGGLPHR